MEREWAGARWKGSVADGVEAAGALALARYDQPWLSAIIDAPGSRSSKPFAPANANAQPQPRQMPAPPACLQPQLECACCGRACNEAAAEARARSTNQCGVEVALQASPSPSPARQQCLSARPTARCRARHQCASRRAAGAAARASDASPALPIARPARRPCPMATELLEGRLRHPPHSACTWNWDATQMKKEHQWNLHLMCRSCAPVVAQIEAQYTAQMFPALMIVKQ